MNENGKRLLGLATGLLFGTILQRSHLARREIILGQLLLWDGRVAKAMGTAVAAGAVGLHALRKNGMAAPEVKPLKAGGVVAGAALFGAGLAVVGYCPGTAVAAAGEGNRDAAAALAGMMTGAMTFVALHSQVKPLIDAGDFGKVSLAP